MSQLVVETSSLVKLYGTNIAVDDLNLQIEEGEVFGFLGPNGAGKTTTILMLLGLTEPTEGEAKICGFDATKNPLEVKKLTGYLPENVGFYEDLTAKENLRFITRLNKIPRKEAETKIDEALRMVDLSEKADSLVGTFSKGMKQRLGIADVLVKDPKLIILDEPTSGIDPKGAVQILDIIVDLAKSRGITVMLSSHLLQRVQKICDRVGIIVRGRLVACGSIEELGKEMMEEGQNIIEIQVTDISDNLIGLLNEISGVTSVENLDNALVIKSTADVRAQVSMVVVESGSSLLYMKAHDYALEEIYLKYFQEYSVV